jgi:peptide/nickel transport system permease protein
MLLFILRRLLMLIPVIIGLTVIMFAIARLLPGDPVGLAAGPNATQAEIAALAVEFGLDQPIWVQYWTYVTGLMQGDLGTSLLTRRPVAADIAAYLPATLELVFAAMAFAVLVGIPLGLVTAVWRNKWPDYLSQVAAIGAISMPRFFVIPPPRFTGFMTIDSLIAGDWDTFTLSLRHLALPAIAMSLSPLATIMRMMRASTIEVMGQDYVMTARALGLSPRLIITKYVARNAISATLTVIGLYFGWLLGGTVLVETVFDWPGLGLYATKAIVSQDMMPVIGVALVIGLLFVLANLIIDVLYGVINPKVRYS